MRFLSSLVLFEFALFHLSLSEPIPTTPRGVPKREPFWTRNYKTIYQIYNFTIFPNQLPIIANAANPNIPQIAHLFSPTVAGRIQDIGNFTNFRTSIEYFFGLAPIPREPLFVAISGFDLTQFSTDCPEVAASTVYFTISVADPAQPNFGKVITYLKQTGFWHFDDRGRVDYYDLYIPALQDFAKIANGADFDQELVQLLATKQICEGVTQACTGPNVQYPALLNLPIGSLISSLGLDKGVVKQLGLNTLNPASLNCFKQLIAKDFGTFDKLWADSVTCRIVHLILAVVDPEEHCPHVGPTGGGKCVDWSYTDRLFNDASLFKEKYRFRCSGRYKTEL
ncbi:hypothetical protein ABW19_dt0210360 [Dactylella cylindrospora]|nr:hypothetical protein ABW19_dt0210360 [Dactylella cylindrospora]